MSTTPSTRERELAVRFLALPKDRRQRFYAALTEQGIELKVLPIPAAPQGSERERLSYAQERLWFLAQLEPDGTAYNMAGALRLTGTPDVQALQSALGAIGQRHESLRTRFVTEAGVPSARVCADAQASLLVSDARAEYARDGERAPEAWAEREAEFVFDLERGPLLRVHLVRFGEADYGLYVCMHHIVSDGWSLRVLIAELARSYEHFVRKTEPVLPALPIQYADYATWQRAWLEAGERERQLSYWREQLAGEQQVLALPLDRPRPDVQSQRGAVHDFVLHAALADELRRLAHAQGVTLFMLGLAAFKALLHRVTGETDLRVGSSVANRTRIETEGLIGFFVNTQVLRTRLAPELTFTQLLAAVKHSALAAQSHQDLPFEQLVAALAPERRLAYNPLFQVHYDHQGGAYDALRSLAGLRVEPIARAQRSTVFDLMLTTQEQADGSIAASFSYATDLFERSSIELLATRFTRILSEVTRAPETQLAALSLSEPDERVQYSELRTLQLADDATRAWLAAHAPEAERVLVLDTAGQPVAHGLVGDLYWSAGTREPTAAGVRARFRRDGALELVLQPSAAVPSPAPRVHAAAGTELEQQLSRVFCDVLQLADVSVDDNFFELGGDSIISIQVVSRARELGIALRPKDLFQHQTVRKLAAVAKPLSASASPGAESGEHRLTPIQQAFFARALPQPDHYNQSVLLVSHAALESSALEQALAAVVAQHAALRSSFLDGQRQLIAPVESLQQRRLLVTAHVADRAEISARCDAAQRSLSLARGELLRALHLRAADGGSWLLLVAHHLVIDGVSWRVLLEDLQRAYTAFSAGEPLQLPAPTSAFGAWAERLHAYADSAELAREGSYWLETCARIQPLPAAEQAATVAEQQRLELRLSRAQTEQLIKESAAAYRTHVQELLLTALSRALCETFGQPEVALWLEGHGREDVFEGIELSRTIGWCTSVFPVVLSPADDLAQSIKRVKEQLRAVPQRGLGYGVLAQLGPEPLRQQLAAAAKPSVAFNYLGQFDASFGEDALFRVADEPAGAELAESTPLEHTLEINGQIYAGGLSLWLSYNPRALDAATLQRLAASFERELCALIEHCAGPDAGGVTPSDFPLARLDQAQLDRLVAETGVPEDVYPVTPMQHGMLFHALYDAEPGVYVTQLAVTIEGLHEARFVEAWRRALERHAILRTQFAWEGRREPLQVVVKRAELAYERYDLRGAHDQAAQLEALVREQHRRRFELQRAPLWRIALVRLDDARYELVWTHHHLLLDGWSTARLLDEVLLDYLGRARPSTGYAFADYVAWLARRDEAASEQFWRERLCSLDEPTILSTAVDAAHERVTAVEVVRTRLSAAEMQALHALAQRERVTLNALVQAAWALLLQRYTGQSSVVFGATTSGRPHDLAGAEQMLGLFINTLPVIVPLQPEATLAQLWQNVQEAGMLAREHEHTPLAKLQRWAGQTALFDTLLVFENFPIDSALQGAWQELKLGKVQTLEITNYALTLGVHPGAELELDYAFEPKLLAASSVQQIADQMLSWLRLFPQLPAALPLGHLVLAGERALQVSSAPNPPFVPLHHALLQRMRARAAQHETLVVGGAGEGWTLAELELRVHALTRALIERGVTTDSRVGLYVQRGPWLIAGALAVWQAGGAYVPLDPSYPRERLSWMVADAQLQLVLCSRGYPELSGTINLDIAEAAAGPALPLTEAVAIHPQQLAYIIYTSGSTGTPKGVGVAHGALAMHAHAIAAQYGYSERDTALQMASASFDASVEQWTTPLLGGARLVLSDEQPWTGSETLAVLRRERVSVIYPPTSQLVALCQQLELSGESYRLRVCCVGGEAVSRENIALIRRNVQPELIINGYGPTETVITPLAWRATADMVCETPYAPIGWTIGDRSAYVLDGELNIQPRGVAGELYLGGSGMARGYLGRAQLTAERFVPDPFGKTPGARLYRTGDRVRALPDGTIEFLGRVDQQVKLRGYRIELGEIEARLLSDSAVIEAVAVVRQDAGKAQLVCYASSAQPDRLQLEAALMQRLREQLPAHMVPSRVLVLPELPHTPNGKIDRRALPAPTLAAREHKPARTALEREILACFAEVLDQSELGVSDDFFELGGDSLVSLQLVSRMRARGYTLSLRDVFSLRTVEALAAAQQGAAAESSEAPIVRVEREAWHALSHAQERLWFLAQLDPDNPAYNIAVGLRLRGQLDQRALQAAFEQLIARHEALRTRFEERDGQGVQRIEPSAVLRIVRFDVRGPDRERRARELFDREVARPFELAQAPLLRVALIQLDASEWVLAVTLHHMIADGWSMRILIEEFASAYSGRSAAPAPALQYLDFASWQRQWLAQGELSRQLQYWRAQLGEEHGALELPLDHPRRADLSHAGGSLEFALDPELSSALARLAQREGASVFMVLLAAWKSVLYRITGQGDLRVGVPVSNRNRVDTEAIVGLFVNTLVLRTQLEAALPFRELLARVKEASLAAHSHQDLPFELLVEALAPERNLSHNPLFQVMFDHQRADLSPLRELPGLRVEPFSVGERAVKLDLSLETIETAEGISGSFNYAAELFERETIAALAERFERVLRAACARPELRLAELPVLSAQEQGRLARWNDTRVALPDDRFVHELIDAVDPAALAVTVGGESLSYGELQTRSQQLAAYLQAQGVGPDALVGVCAERSLELIVSLLGVLKAGAAYLPLDPSYPPERLRSMIEDSGAKLVITQARLRERLACPTFCIDQAWPRDAVLQPTPRSDAQLAYCIYTSGSTGKPKGVELTQAGFRNYVRWALDAYKLSELDVSLLHSSIAFDLTVTSLWLPLCAGKRVVLVPETDDVLAGLARSLCELDARGERSLLKITPSHALALSTLIERPLLNVQAWIVGGEALSWECSAQLQRMAPNSRVINEYGPTETVVGCSVYEAQVAAVSGSSVPIGAAIANMELYVLDEALQSVAPGVTGELYIGGVALARGYRGRPGLTAERFVPHPFACAGERVYRTGDLARYRADGTLEYLGRRDDQIKLRGHRIELGEIEAALRDHPEVQDAVVIARDQRLIAYVAPLRVQADELYAQLRARLPAYMVPAQLVVLEALPLTSNGKVDRKRLPAVQADDSAYSAPQSAIEQQLCAIIAEVLRVPRVGRSDDFFALGGDSIRCLQVVSRARKCGIGLRPRDLFEARSVAELAQLAESLQPAAAPELVPVARDSELHRLSYAQDRMWFLAQLEPDSSAYNMASALRIQGELDRDRLQRALDALLARHEALRTSFELCDGVPVQRVHPRLTLQVQYLEASAHDARACVEELAHTPFDLTRAPLLRVALLRLGAEEHVLAVVVHHIVSDGWSLDVAIAELIALYTSPHADLPALPVQYVDYAVWQRKWLNGPERARQLAYWQAELGDEHPVLSLPAQGVRRGAQTFRGAVIERVLDAELASALQVLARAHGVSMFMLLLAAWQTLLYRLTGQPDIRVGVPVTNRSRVETERLIGLFVNTQVLRSELRGDKRFATLLQEVKRTALGASAHRDLPFEQLVEALQPARSLGQNPLFQVTFNHASAAPSVHATAAPFALSTFEWQARTTQFDLSLDSEELADQRLRLAFTYASDVLDADSVERLAARLQQLLRQVSAEPTRRIAELAVLVEPERAQLLAAAGPRAEAPLPSSPFVHAQIAARAALQPAAIALQDERGAGYSYAQLERRSNQWAQRLRRYGVGPEVRVGLCMSRSPELIMVALAISKAGGAYVALDPSYPVERLREIASAAGLSVIVTQHAQLWAAQARCIEFDAEDVRNEPVSAPLVALAPDNLAYIVYTSGSTGRPKGVAVSHGALAEHIAAIGADYGLQPDDCVVQFASLSFDAGVEQWVAPLVHGARLLVRGDELWSAERALAVLREQRVSWLDATPGYLSELARTALARAERVQLRGCIAGGEALPRESLSTILEALAPARLINSYGPTEAVITPMTWHVTDAASCDTAYAPIGRAVGARCAYVLDADLNLVAPGVTGELYLSGTALARGYHDRPGLSAERFLPDPFAQRPGARMYRTGDLARVLPSGDVEFIGRADQQIKLRGFRIELGEIEARIRENGAVRDVLVIASAAQQLVAYVVGDVEVAALDAQLTAALPAYMVPSQWVLMVELPRNLNGKLDRARLPEPEAAAQSFSAPETAIEHKLAEIWRDVLQVAQVGRTDNFFALGGHSLLVMRVVTRVQAELGVELAVRELFETGDLRELAALVERSSASRQELAAAVADSLSELSNLSEEELAELLNEAEE